MHRPVRILQLEYRDVGLFWHRVIHWIDRAYAETDLPVPANLLDDLAIKHKQMWIAVIPAEGKILGVAITQLAKMRNNVHAQIIACGGVEGARWIDRGIRCIEHWARLEGATKVTLQGRAGWHRLLRRRSYRRSQVILELDLRQPHVIRQQDDDHPAVPD